MRRADDEKRRMWEQTLREFRRSGLSRRAFCEQNGIKKSRLDYRLARLGTPTETSGFVEVKPAVATTLGGRLDVVVRGRYRIEIQGALDTELFAEVVRVLESLG